MTKVSVFGQQSTEKKELKKIEFVKRMDNKGNFYKPRSNPKDFDNICLYCKSDIDGFDVILAWDNHSDYAKSIYLGHWNDGVV